MEGIDPYYTPKVVAMDLLKTIDDPAQGVIADFAAGGGELLECAERLIPGRRMLALDISPEAVKCLRRDHPTWATGRCDFLSSRSRAASPVLRQYSREISVIVANPPFSYRGGAHRVVRTGSGENLRCSPAIAFILNAIKYLRKGGTLFAIVPAGALSSEKDTKAIEWIQQIGDLTRLDDYPRGTFTGCSPRTVALRFVYSRSQSNCKRRNEPRARTASVVSAHLLRGSIQMHKPFGRGYRYPLVHTTELRENSVTIPERSIQDASRVVAGPAVLFPRVGNPVPEKLTVYTAPNPIALSDCVYALRCSSSSDALWVLNTLLNAWQRFQMTYKGTCAPYLTISDLVPVLESEGVLVQSINGVEQGSVLQSVAPSFADRVSV